MRDNQRHTQRRDEQPTTAEQAAFVQIQHELDTAKEAYEHLLSTSRIHTRLAMGLARGYRDLFYVNLDADTYIAYATGGDGSTLSEIRRGERFFERCKQYAHNHLHPDDRDAFVRAMDRETLLDVLERNKTFFMTYRLLTETGVAYVTAKMIYMEDNGRFLIIGVTDNDEQLNQQKLAERAQEERAAYTRLNALIGDFLCVFIVDPDTGNYRQFSSTAGFKNYSRAGEGKNFFDTSIKARQRSIYPGDLERFLSVFTKENVLAEVERSGIFSLTYRLMIDDKPNYVQIRAAMVEEPEGQRLIVGINDIDASVRQEEDYARRLAQAQSEANKDALTGVRNRHAFLEAEANLDRQIAEQRAPDFAIVILDVNDLKKVNDNEGHQAGDEYLRDACKIICDTFKHSPVFRVGGDEFAVIAQGSDFEAIEELLDSISHHNQEAARIGGVVVACGMSKVEGDPCVAPVFERADQKMYENKSVLKEGR